MRERLRESTSNRLRTIKAKLKVVDIMRNNVEAVLERDAKISMMDDRADALHQGASQFETQAAKLKNKFWLENMKYMIALGVVVLIFVAVAVCKYFPRLDSRNTPVIVQEWSFK